MSSQSHVSQCRVLPLGKFTVTIPEPHATLQGAVTWRNQCRDRSTLQGVRIPSGILKIVFRHIFLFLMQFRLWRAAAFSYRLRYTCYNQIAQVWCQSEEGILSQQLSCSEATARHALVVRRRFFMFQQDGISVYQHTMPSLSWSEREKCENGHPVRRFLSNYFDLLFYVSTG